MRIHAFRSGIWKFLVRVFGQYQVGFYSFLNQVSWLAVWSIFVHNLFGNQYFRERHFYQGNHYRLVNCIGKKCSVIIGKIFNFDSSEKVCIETHQPVLFVLKMVSESISFEIKLINVSTFSELCWTVREF